MSFSTNRSTASVAGGVARRAVMAGLAGALTLALVGCGGAQTTTGATGSEAESSTQADTQAEPDAADDSAYYRTAEGFTIDASDLFSERDLAGDYDAKEAVGVELSDDGTKATEGVSVDGSTVSITAEGTYVLSGELTDGRVVVDADDAAKVQLVLDGARLSSSTGCALYVKNADKVFLTLAKGSQNAIGATGPAAEQDDHTLDGAVFAADDLTVNGEGTLEVSSAQGSGIVGKDEVTLTGGTLDITAAEHAIQAKDSLAAADGTYTLEAGKDGIHVAHDTNGEKGFAYFKGGTFTIVAKSDGIDAGNDILIDGGTFTVAADDDGIHSEYDLIVNDATIDVTQCYEGLEGARYEQNGGDIRIVASDDGVNAVGNPDGTAGGEDRDFGQRPDMEGGPQGADGSQDGGAGSAGTDGADAAGDAQDSQGKGGHRGPRGGHGPQGGPGQGTDTGTPPEGMEPSADSADADMPEGGTQGEGAEPPAMPEGESGDTTGQMPQGGPMGGGQGGPMMDSDDTASLTINGGTIVVDASGDGLDSNGALVMNGGEAYVSGPTNDGNGALDYGTYAKVSGGVLVAVGSSGMAETFGTDSTQGSLLVAASGKAGELVELKDASGKVLASYTPTKDFACVVATAPGVLEGETYTVEVAGTATEVTLDSISYRGVQASMGNMMGGGGRGGMGGPRRQGFGQDDRQVSQQETTSA